MRFLVWLGLLWVLLDATRVRAQPTPPAATENGPKAPAPTSQRRSRPEQFVPFLNLAMGPRWPLPVGNVAFALDLTIGARMGWTRDLRPMTPGFWLSPQLGYSHTTQTHLLIVGTGLGFGARRIAVDYTPRFIVGTGPAGTLLGVRHGLSLHLLNGLLGVEVAHQYTGEHDARLMFYLNPGLLIVGGLFLLAARPVITTNDLF